MEWDVIAPMFVTTVLILTVGGVLILRPVSKRLGGLIELMIEERKVGGDAELGQIRDLLETTNARLSLLEERQDFSEQIMKSRSERTLPASEADSTE